MKKFSSADENYDWFKDNLNELVKFNTNFYHSHFNKTPFPKISDNKLQFSCQFSRL